MIHGASSKDTVPKGCCVRVKAASLRPARSYTKSKAADDPVTIEWSSLEECQPTVLNGRNERTEMSESTFGRGR
jgi:hypothetical protein